jgi:hypothetical protein
MSARSKLGFAFLILVAATFAFFHLRYPGRAPAALPVSSCDSSLWQRTYENERLQMIMPCTAVEGRVVSVHINSDGDAHIGLEPDDRRILNLINATHARGELITEVVCDHAPTDKGGDSYKVRDACSGYTSATTLPHTGDRVRITGSYVTDRDNGWREIHPISKIEVLR